MGESHFSHFFALPPPLFCTRNSLPFPFLSQQVIPTRKVCKSLDQKDEILKAAAVNGNVDILRAAVKDGYDLLPLVAMEMKTINPDNDSDEDDGYFYSDDEVDVYYTIYQ